MDLEQLFRSINRKMLLDFEEISSQVQHRGAKGRMREKLIVSDYLQKYLPGNIGVSNGEIVSTEGQVSPEQDIIFYERNSSPFLLAEEGFQVFPIECVYGVLEVKSHLDKSSLTEAVAGIHRVKMMKKLAFAEQRSVVVRSTELYGKTWPHFPTLGFIIAFDSIDLKTLLSHYDDLVNTFSIEERVDSIWVLRKGMIINHNPKSGTIELAPSPSTDSRVMLSDNPLMLLTIQLQALLGSGWMARFSMLPYLDDAIYGDLITP